MMDEETLNQSYSELEEPTFYRGNDGTRVINTNNNGKTINSHQQQKQYHHHQQEDQRHSNRDSGISSEKQKQQQQQFEQGPPKQKITEHLSRFLSDTMRSQQSFEYQRTKSVSGESSGLMDFSMNADGKVLIEKSKTFVTLANDWENRKALKERQLPHKSQPTSSVMPTSNLQEGARGEINPTRFSDRLTPEVEILHESEKREIRPRSKYYETGFSRDDGYETRGRSNHAPIRRRPSATRKEFFELDARPLSRPRSHSNSKRSCTSSCGCCPHTVYKIYNYGTDPYGTNYENHHSDGHRSRKPITDGDDRILAKLSELKAVVTQSKRIVKAVRKHEEYDDDVFSFSPPRYTKKSYKKTVEFGSIDSGIEEPSYKKVEIPSHISSHTIMALLNFNKKYEFLATLARNLLIHRKNVKNLVAEFEAALSRHADLLKRQIIRLELQLPKTYTPKYSAAEKQIDEARKNLFICMEKAKEFEAAIQRDKITFQKLPEDGCSRQRVPDMDYQKRIIYEIFAN